MVFLAKWSGNRRDRSNEVDLKLISYLKTENRRMKFNDDSERIGVLKNDFLTSFPRKIAERRMCAFLNWQKLIDALKDRRSPLLIEVLRV